MSDDTNDDTYVCSAPTSRQPGYCENPVADPTVRCDKHPRTVLEEPLDVQAHERPNPDEFEAEIEIEAIDT